jgi:hypothetical protein
VSLVELLRTKSSEYELVAEWHAERAPLDEEHFVACQAMALVAIVLREVAEAIDLGWERKGQRRGLRPVPPCDEGGGFLLTDPAQPQPPAAGFETA